MLVYACQPDLQRLQILTNVTNQFMQEETLSGLWMNHSRKKKLMGMA
jgi:hypothetical protein